MQALHLAVALLLVTMSGCARDPDPGRAPLTPVNRVVGDASFIAAAGRTPGPDDDDRARVQLHLDWVEAALRQRPTDHLGPELTAARRRNLDRLRDYAEAGRFPYNDDHPDARRPTFVDHAGNLCAVGHLMAQDLGVEAALEVSRTHKYDFVEAIDDPTLQGWAATSGLTRRELAMIQPGYGPPFDPGKLREDPREHLRHELIRLIRAQNARLTQCFVRYQGAAPPDLKTAQLRVMVELQPSGKVKLMRLIMRRIAREEGLERCVADTITAVRLKSRVEAPAMVQLPIMVRLPPPRDDAPIELAVREALGDPSALVDACTLPRDKDLPRTRPLQLALRVAPTRKVAEVTPGAAEGIRNDMIKCLIYKVKLKRTPPFEGAHLALTLEVMVPGPPLEPAPDEAPAP